MKPGLSLRTSQHLALTVQLQQSIRLLQLSTLELHQEVEQMLADNPFLEPDDAPLEREAFGLAQADTPVSTGDRAVEQDTHGDAEPSSSEPEQLSWEGDGSADLSYGDGHWEGEADTSTPHNPSDPHADATAWTQPQERLSAFLLRQTAALRLCAEDRAALHFLIESLNDDGYLEEPLAELAQALQPQDEAQAQALVEHLTLARALLQNLEPTGVGARDLGECLRLQLRACADMDTQVREVALRICEQPMALLARRDVRRYVQLGLGTDAQVRQALSHIASLEPKPGRRFADVQRNVVVPDVLVRPVQRVRTDGGRTAQVQFAVQINPDVMPRLRAHQVYSQLLSRQRNAAGYAGLQQQLQEARWFIKSIQQRFDTILRVSRAIVERQKGFFMHGELAMRPLVLRDIADELGLHESTLSRVTTAKYIATPFGTFELKYFFGSGLSTDAGGNASSTAVRALIKQLISSESAAKPLSDQQIAVLLQEQGIECARRTVAKYREGLKIPVASLRKAL